MDILHINALTLPATVGAHRWEQHITQPIVFDIELGIDVKKAAQSDALADAIDYTAVVQALTDLLAQHPFALLETLAERCADHLLTEFDTTWVRLKACKPTALNRANVGIQIQRSRV